MPSRIEDYALIGNCRTAALISREGSIDWLCVPRFDSSACFCAILGTPEHGRWQIAPVGEFTVCREYRHATLILETEFTTPAGVVRVTDCMVPEKETPIIIRRVECLSGVVQMHTELVIRFEYGSIVPWVSKSEWGGITAVAGPNMLHLRARIPLTGENFKTVGTFSLEAGQHETFVLSWTPSHQHTVTEVENPLHSIAEVELWWRSWCARCTYEGPWQEAVQRSLITLKALTYSPTGGIVAAPTTSLPEFIGGVRNWDYRYCWLRDTTFTLYALLNSGYIEEARQWRRWLLRAVAGKPDQLCIMYGVAGERDLYERELSWLPGFENSLPVRIGNGAFTQFQLDVYGEVMDAFHLATRRGLEPDLDSWAQQRNMLTFIEDLWQKPDDGIWEIRGMQRHFTFSKVMAWVAFDRGIHAAESYGLGDVDKWKGIREQIHAEICEQGFNKERNSFVQYYGADEVDASLLMMALVGFLPADDPRIVGTVEAIKEDLLRDGFMLRYRTETPVDGLPPGEGVFLVCTFWLADNLILQGKREEAQEIFERVLAIRNDVGLLAEEWDHVDKRFLGNFPQAFSHIGLINTAHNLSVSHGAAEDRSHTE